MVKFYHVDVDKVHYHYATYNKSRYARVDRPRGAVISRTLRKETIKPTTATETAITSVTRAVCAIKLEQ